MHERERHRILQAKIQTVVEIHGLVWSALASKQRIEPAINRRFRLFLSAQTGRNNEGSDV